MVRTWQCKIVDTSIDRCYRSNVGVFLTSNIINLFDFLLNKQVQCAQNIK